MITVLQTTQAPQLRKTPTNKLTKDEKNTNQLQRTRQYNFKIQLWPKGAKLLSAFLARTWELEEHTVIRPQGQASCWTCGEYLISKGHLSYQVQNQMASKNKKIKNKARFLYFQQHNSQK